MMGACRPGLLLAAFAGGLSSFVVLANAVARRRTVGSDEAVREQVQAVREPADQAKDPVDPTNPLGQEWLHGPVALATSGYLWSRGAGWEALAPTLASAASELQSRLLDQLHLRGVPPGHPHQGKSGFPSGHALESFTVGVTIAYVLARQGVVPATPALTTAVALSLATTTGRIYLDRHWISDAAGGWLLGIATTAACIGYYEAFCPAPGPERADVARLGGAPPTDGSR